MTTTSSPNARVEFAFGLLLFAVNAAFSFLLYMELASGTWYYQVLYGTLAVVFDVGMMLLWVRGVRAGNVAFIVIALAFACITLFASSASALTIIERKVHVVEADTSQVADLRFALEQTDADIAANRGAIDKTPPDFTTRLRELNALARELRSRRDEQAARLREASRESAAERSTATSMFTLAAKALGVDDEGVMLPFLLGTSLMLIVGSFALTTPRRESVASTLVKATYGTRTHFLDARGKALCGAPPAPAANVASFCDLCVARALKEKMK